MGFSRAIDPASLHTQTLAQAVEATEPPTLAKPSQADRATSQTMVNQVLTDEVLQEFSPALSPALVNAADGEQNHEAGADRSRCDGARIDAPSPGALEIERPQLRAPQISPPDTCAPAPDDPEAPEDYAINHWRRHESEAEHAFRVMRAEDEAQALFARATVKQKEAYDAAMADLRGLRAPRYDRIRAAALRGWRDSTGDARTLYFRTCDTLMREGEIPDALDRAWTRLIDPERAAWLWPRETSG